MTTYKSKIGLELVIPICIILGGTGFLSIYEKKWIGLGIILLVIAFIAHLFLTTYYQVNGNMLKIKSGFLFNKTIDINSIKEIKETNNPLSSPAISLDRIVISYNKHDTVIISPKERKGFINQLIRVNPAIRVILKKK